MRKNIGLFALLIILYALIAVYSWSSERVPVPAPTLTATATPSEEPTATPSPTFEPTPTQEVSQRRDCNRISYNINGFAIIDWNYLQEHLVALNPCSVLMMDDSGRALDLLQLLPDSLIIFRPYHKSDGGQCWVKSGKAQVDDYIRVFRDKAIEKGMNEYSYQQIALYGCSNEPHVGTDAKLQELLALEIAFMQEARNAGITVVSGNWAVGTINPSHIESGYFDDYLREVYRLNHYIGVHEYTTYCLCVGLGYLTRNQIMNRDNVQPDTWPMRVPMERIFLPQTADYDDYGTGITSMPDYYFSFSAQNANGFLPPNYHLFRSIWLWIRAQEQGIPMRNNVFILTEGLHDRLDDLRANPGGINPVEYLQNTYGMTNQYYHRDIRGAPSHCKLWETYYYPQFDNCAEALMVQYVWWDAIAPELYHSVNIFTWSQNVHWITFNVDGTEPTGYILHDYLENYTNRLMAGDLPVDIFNQMIGR